jgi:hypothetical protein
MEYSVKQIIPFRLLSIYAYDAIRKGHHIYALVEFDATEIREYQSLTIYITHYLADGANYYN